jgi:hypothetical protein
MVTYGNLKREWARNWENCWDIFTYEDNQQPSLEFKSSLKVQRLILETSLLEYNRNTSTQHTSMCEDIVWTIRIYKGIENQVKCLIDNKLGLSFSAGVYGIN